MRITKSGIGTVIFAVVFVAFWTAPFILPVLAPHLTWLAVALSDAQDSALGH